MDTFFLGKTFLRIKKEVAMCSLFYFPNHLLLFSFKHIINIGREKCYDIREEIRNFLKKIKNINCVKQNKLFVVIDRKATPEDVNYNSEKGSSQPLLPLYTYRGFNEVEIRRELEANDAELLQKEVKNTEYIVEEEIDKEVGFKRIKIAITLQNEKKG